MTNPKMLETNATSGKMYGVVFTKIPEMAVVHMRTVFLLKESAARNPI